MTSTELANNALDHIGVPHIDDIDSVTSMVAVKCKAAYPKSRETFIRNASPRFRKEADLAIKTGESSDVWDYVYGRPTDCLDIREIWNGTTNDDPRVDFEEGLHSNGSSLTILTNKESALLVYTADVTNLTLFSVDDTNAIEYFMASILASSVNKDQEQRQRMRSEYEFHLAKARSNSKRNQHKALPKQNRYIKARR